MSITIEKPLRALVLKVIKLAAKKKVQRWASTPGPDVQFKFRGTEYDFYVTKPEAKAPHPKAKRMERKLKVSGDTYTVWKHKKKR